MTGGHGHHYPEAPHLGATHATHGHGGPAIEPQGQLVRVFCEANPDFFLTASGEEVILAQGNPHDTHQIWIKDESLATRLHDEEGSPAFALVNKATFKALKHLKAELNEPVILGTYNHNAVDESFLWTESKDEWKGYRTIRLVTNIHLNLDANHGDKKSGGVKNGTSLILFKWNKGENQKWKIVPI